MRTAERRHYLAHAPRMMLDFLFRGKFDYTYDLMPFRFRRIPLVKRLNLLRAGLNLFHRKLSPWGWPINLMVELTDFCDLRCPVCPTGTKKLRRRPRAMEPSAFDALLQEAGPYLLTASLWGWGEPLLHPRLPEMLRIARRHGVATILSTNGQRLNDPKVIEALVNDPPTYLVVALDGLCDQTNSVYRVGAKLEPALEGIRTLAKMKRARQKRLPILLWRYIVMKHNQHEIPYLKEFAASNRFEMLSLRSLSIIDASENPHKKLVPDSRDYRAYGYDGGNRVHRNDFICQYAFNFPTVLADGTVVVCDQDFNAGQPYGTLSPQMSFGRIWFGESARRVRRTVKFAPEKFSTCRNCPYADRPLSSCSLEAYDLRPAEDRYIPLIVPQRPSPAVKNVGQGT